MLTWPPWQKNPPPPPIDLLEEEQEDEIGPPPVPEAGLRLSPEQRFPDIPLPVEVKEDSRTYVFQSSSLRVGRLVYATRAQVKEIAAFYLRECPAADWELMSVVQADGATLTFKKGGEQLIIRARDLGVARGREFELHVTPEPH